MGKRQPDGADLPPSKRKAVDDLSTDDEVSAGVVMPERQVETRVMNGDGSGAES